MKMNKNTDFFPEELDLDMMALPLHRSGMALSHSSGPAPTRCLSLHAPAPSLHLLNAPKIVLMQHSETQDVLQEAPVYINRATTFSSPASAPILIEAVRAYISSSCSFERLGRYEWDLRKSFDDGLALHMRLHLFRGDGQILGELHRLGGCAFRFFDYFSALVAFLEPVSAQHLCPPELQRKHLAAHHQQQWKHLASNHHHQRKPEPSVSDVEAEVKEKTKQRKRSLVLKLRKPPLEVVSVQPPLTSKQRKPLLSMLPQKQQQRKPYAELEESGSARVLMLSLLQTACSCSLVDVQCEMLLTASRLSSHAPEALQDCASLLSKLVESLDAVVQRYSLALLANLVAHAEKQAPLELTPTLPQRLLCLLDSDADPDVRHQAARTIFILCQMRRDLLSTDVKCAIRRLSASAVGSSLSAVLESAVVQLDAFN